MSHPMKPLAAIAAAAAALALTACGGGAGGSANTTAAGRAGTAAVPTIVVRNAEPVGGVQRLEYTAGEEIRFKVKSDTADEVHFHGYDVGKEIAAGGTASFDVPAEIEGIFEVELEEHHEQIAEVRVNP
jgi:hypothetical protein